MHNLGERLVHFPFAVSRQAPIGPGDPVPEEADVEEYGGEEEKGGEDPDDEGEEHARQNDHLPLVFHGQLPKLIEEAENLLSHVGSTIARELDHVDRPQRQGIDNLARPRTQNDANPCCSVSFLVSGAGN